MKEKTAFFHNEKIIGVKTQSGDKHKPHSQTIVNFCLVILKFVLVLFQGNQQSSWSEDCSRDFNIVT